MKDLNANQGAVVLFCLLLTANLIFCIAATLNLNRLSKQVQELQDDARNTVYFEIPAPEANRRAHRPSPAELPPRKGF